MTEELKQELSKIPFWELINFYEGEKNNMVKAEHKSATRRHTIGKLNAFAKPSFVDKYNHILEYSVEVSEGILCYVKMDSLEKMLKEINEVIVKYQK